MSRPMVQSAGRWSSLCCMVLGAQLVLGAAPALAQDDEDGVTEDDDEDVGDDEDVDDDEDIDDDEDVGDDEDIDEDVGESEDVDDDDPLGDDEAPAAKEEIDQGIPEGGETVADDLGGATNFVFPTGFYISSDLGGFLRFGGYGDSSGNSCLRCVPRLISDLQPWIGINIGYDIIPNFGIEATLGTGFIGNSSPRGYSFGEAVPPGVGNSPENMAVSMLNVAATGSWYFLDRLAIQGKAFVGGSFLTPDPDPSRLNFVRGLTCSAGNWGGQSPDTECGGEFGGDFGALFGLGAGLRYATLLPGVIIGFDVSTYVVWSMNIATQHTGGVVVNGSSIPPPINLGFAIPIIPAFSFAPVIKYVF